jgi:chromosomal replication initiation ATPase DnaA
MTQQLTFDLPVRSALGRDDFFVSPANAVALAAVDGFTGWPQGKLVLVGASGAGKTHLAHVFAAQAQGRVVAASNIVVGEIDNLADTALALDGADQPLDETALFHLHNLMAERGLPFLLTAQAPPARWNIALPDLASRMSAASVAFLDPPDDTLLTAVLAKHFSDRQLKPPANVIPFLVTHMERSLAEAAEIVAEIDKTTLSERRNISRSLVAEILDRRGRTSA